MITVTLDEIEKDVSAYIHRVQAGETLVVLEADQPVAEIRPIGTSEKKPRPFGLAAGQLGVSDQGGPQGGH